MTNIIKENENDLWNFYTFDYRITEYHKTLSENDLGNFYTFDYRIIEYHKTLSVDKFTPKEMQVVSSVSEKPLWNI